MFRIAECPSASSRLPAVSWQGRAGQGRAGEGQGGGGRQARRVWALGIRQSAKSNRRAARAGRQVGRGRCDSLPRLGQVIEAIEQQSSNRAIEQVEGSGEGASRAASGEVLVPPPCPASLRRKYQSSEQVQDSGITTQPRHQHIRSLRRCVRRAQAHTAHGAATQNGTYCTWGDAAREYRQSCPLQA